MNLTVQENISMQNNYSHQLKMRAFTRICLTLQHARMTRVVTLNQNEDTSFLDNV